MVSKKSRIVAAVAVTLFSFITVAYISCTKTASPNLHTCNGVLCQNGGYCHVDTVTKKPSCVCPTGYEGANCSVASVAKFIGTWNAKQTVIGSDSVNDIGMVSNYSILLKNSATPTTFLIDNFSANPYYNELVCTLDSNDSYRFTVDTISAFHMIFDHYKILSGAGSITAGSDTINIIMITDHLSPTSNHIKDTISFVFTH